MTALPPSPASAGGALGFTVTGWAAVAALAVAVLAALALVFGVLASSQRTARLARIINALRGNDTPAPRARAAVRTEPGKTPTE